jgi:glycosyltransferase involved in cell wall biosynthesis
MKTLIVGISAEGSVNLLRGQMKYFKNLGYKTYLIAPYSERSSDFCRNEGCHHIVIPIKREISFFSDLLNLFRIIVIFRRIDPDIINFGTPKVSLLGMIAGKLLNVEKRIYTCRGFRYEDEQGSKRRLLMLMERITCWCSHKIICISPSLRELGIKDKIFSEKNSLVINKGSSNGVDLELFDRALVPEDLQKQLRIDLQLDGKFVFGFVGRIVDRKGIRQLYQAFDELYLNNKNLRLALVGPYEHAQLTDKKLITDIENHPGIIYLGRKPQDQIPLYLTLIDVFVLPTWSEGFGNVLVQSAAMGIPVISTDITGAKDAVSADYNGILVPVKAVAELKQAMDKIYSNNELRQVYSNNGREWAKNFNRQVIWEGLAKLYDKGNLSEVI